MWRRLGEPPSSSRCLATMLSSMLSLRFGSKPVFLRRTHRSLWSFSAQACSTRIYEATAEERLEEEEVGLDEVRTEGYLLGSPGRETRGFRDPLRSEDPNLPCLASSSSTLALPAPPETASLLFPPPPEVPQEGNQKRKARERDLLNQYAAEGIRRYPAPSFPSAPSGHS